MWSYRARSGARGKPPRSHDHGRDAPHASSTRRATPCWRIAFSTALNCKPNVARHEIIPRQHRPEPSPNGFLSNADSHRHPSSRRSIEIKMLPLFSRNGPKQGGICSNTALRAQTRSGRGVLRLDSPATSLDESRRAASVCRSATVFHSASSRVEAKREPGAPVTAIPGLPPQL